MDATFQEVQELWLQSTSQHIDAVFTHYWDNSTRLDELKSRLRENADFGYWKPLIEEAFRAFDATLYLVVVPAMLSILEAVWHNWAA